MVGDEQIASQAGQLGQLPPLLGSKTDHDGFQPAKGADRLELATLALGGLRKATWSSD